MFPPDRLNEEVGILERIRAGQRVEHFETVRVCKDGRHLHVSLTISPIRDESGAIIGASKIARDITTQKEIVARLAATNGELRRADRMKGEFLATLSHELRTPLSAILGWVQLLKDAPTAVEVEEGVQVIERQVKMQQQLIEDLLDMSRIDAGKVGLDVQRIDLVAIAEAAIETVRPTAEAKAISLTSVFASLGGILMGDRGRMQQIIWNLLTNAIKFTPRHGQVHVLVERVNSHVELSVSDTGQGIAPEFLDQIFERFRQADSSITRQHGGLGLGLSIAKQLAELHGGSLRVKSEGVGKGATFVLHFPLRSAHRTPEHIAADERNAELDAAPANPELRGIRVLAVDDELDSALIIKRLLERNGAEVRLAHSMEGGLAEFVQFSPHVILSDIGMPGHDGYEFISRLRTLDGGRGVPAVALTALARSQDRTRALRAGFQFHLAKPADAAELVAVVQNLAALRGSSS